MTLIKTTSGASASGGSLCTWSKYKTNIVVVFQRLYKVMKRLPQHLTLKRIEGSIIRDRFTLVAFYQKNWLFTEVASVFWQH